MEAPRRSGLRKPLGDLTNTLPHSRSYSSLPRNKPKRNPVPSAAISKLLPNSAPKSPPRTAAAADADSTPSRRPLPRSGEEQAEEVEPCSVYSRRPSAKKRNSVSDLTDAGLSKSLSSEKRKSKGKEVAGALSCPPPTKCRKIGERVNEDEGNNLPIACTTMPKKKQSHKPSREDSENALTREYIEQQRAYFAEIDAFELPVEEVEVIDDE